MKKKYLAYMLSAAMLTSMMPTTSVYADVTKGGTEGVVLAAEARAAGATFVAENIADMKVGTELATGAKAPTITITLTEEKFKTTEGADKANYTVNLPKGVNIEKVELSGGSTGTDDHTVAKLTLSGNPTETNATAITVTVKKEAVVGNGDVAATTKNINWDVKASDKEIQTVAITGLTKPATTVAPVKTVTVTGQQDVTGAVTWYTNDNVAEATVDKAGTEYTTQGNFAANTGNQRYVAKVVLTAPNAKKFKTDLAAANVTVDNGTVSTTPAALKVQNASDTSASNTLTFLVSFDAVTNQDVVADPTFNPAGGANEGAAVGVDAGGNIEISSTTADAKIFYTTNGTDPTGTASDTEKEYIKGTPLKVDDLFKSSPATVTIKALAKKDGATNSQVVTAVYKLNKKDEKITAVSAEGWKNPTVKDDVADFNKTGVAFTTTPEGKNATVQSVQWKKMLNADAQSVTLDDFDSKGEAATGKFTKETEKKYVAKVTVTSTDAKFEAQPTIAGITGVKTPGKGTEGKLEFLVVVDAVGEGTPDTQTTAAITSGNIEGTVGTELTQGTKITVKLTNGTFGDAAGTVGNYTVNMPNGTEGSAADAVKIETAAKTGNQNDTVDLTLKGTPKVASTDAISVTIKKEALTDGKADVTATGQAKWNITDPNAGGDIHAGNPQVGADEVTNSLEGTTVPADGNVAVSLEGKDKGVLTISKEIAKALKDSQNAQITITADAGKVVLDNKALKAIGEKTEADQTDAKITVEDNKTAVAGNIKKAIDVKAEVNNASVEDLKQGHIEVTFETPAGYKDTHADAPIVYALQADNSLTQTKVNAEYADTMTRAMGDSIKVTLDKPMKIGLLDKAPAAPAEKIVLAVGKDDKAPKAVVGDKKYGVTLADIQIEGAVYDTKDATQATPIKNIGKWVWVDETVKPTVAGTDCHAKFVLNADVADKYDAAALADVTINVKVAEADVTVAGPAKAYVKQNTKANQITADTFGLKVTPADAAGDWKFYTAYTDANTNTPIQDSDFTATGAKNIICVYTPTADNYVKTPVQHTVNVTVTDKEVRTLTFGEAPVVKYGQEVPADGIVGAVLKDNKQDASANDTVAPAVKYSVDTAGVVEIDAATGKITKILKAGKTTITATAEAGTGAGAYTDATASYELVVSPAELTISVTPADKQTFDKNSAATANKVFPTYTVNVAGYVNNETAADAFTTEAAIKYYNKENTVVDEATVKATVGVYTVKAEGAVTKDNYTIKTATDGQLEVIDSSVTPPTPPRPNRPSGGGSSHGHGGGSSYTSKNPVHVITSGSSKNGRVEISDKNAKAGDKVTVTVKPDDGYELDKIIIKDRVGSDKIDVEKDGNKYTFVMPKSAKVEVEPIFVKVDKDKDKEDKKEEETNKGPIEMNTITTKTFNDVRANDWFKTAVDYVVSNGIMAGVGDREFAPNQNMTRAMVWQVLAKIDGVNTVGGDKWYSRAMEWATSRKITDGSNVNGKVTREQIASMLYRYAKDKGVDVSMKGTLANFPDASKASSYATEALQWAVGNGIINGMDGKLNPQGTATRAQVATMLMNFDKVVK